MASLKDVAREAGVAQETASRVLNNRGYISEKTRQRVMEAVEKLHYQPNEIARSLSRKKTDTIGLLVPHIMHPYFAEIISCVVQAAARKHYKVLLYNTGGNPETEKQYLEVCEGNQVSGILLLSPNVPEEELRTSRKPVIVIERELKGGASYIGCDNFQGGLLAGAHLLERGCRHLLMLGGIDAQDMPADRREDGFREAMASGHAEYKVLKTRAEDYNEMAYRDHIRSALRQYPETDGIFASSDVIAAQVIQVAAEMHRQVPGDIRLVGFDDVNIAGFCTPAITTIHQPVQDMADTAVECVIRAARGEKVQPRHIFPVTLIRRDST